MNWKKILKYFLIVWLISTIVLGIIAQRNMTKIWGGLTEQVDANQFVLESIPFALNNVSVLSADGTRFIPNQIVYIDKGLIVSVDSIGNQSDNIQQINGEGKFLIPGLTDAHIHLFKSRNDLLLYLANGITQIRELIGSEEILGWKGEIENGGLGPDMFVSSPRLGSFGKLEGWWMSWAQGYDNISNANEAKKAVEFYHKKGYDGIKIYSQLNKESYDAVCETAETLDMPVMGHIPYSIILEDLYESSQNEVAHFEEIMNALNREFGYYNGENASDFVTFVEGRIDNVAKSLISKNITITSTLFGTENLVNQKYDLETTLKKAKLEYVNPGLLEWTTMAPGGPGWLPEVNMYKVPGNLTPEQYEGRKRHWETYVEVELLVARKLISNGVNIMAGTDACIPVKVPGFSLHDEFESLQRAGMSNEQILKAATSIPANYMKMNVGQILPNRKANLVLLDKNPLLDIKNTKTINSVILNGKVLNRDLLDEILESVIEVNNSSRNLDISKFIDKEN